MALGDSVDKSDAQLSVLPPRSDEQAMREILDVERQRIERDNRRSAVMEKALELADAQDKRQFEFASQARDADIEFRQRHFGFLRQVVVGLGGSLVVIVLALLGFAFFGSEEQRQIAEAIVTPALIGLAGYGVVTALTKVVKSMPND